VAGVDGARRIVTRAGRSGERDAAGTGQAAAGKDPHIPRAPVPKDPHAPRSPAAPKIPVELLPGAMDGPDRPAEDSWSAVRVTGWDRSGLVASGIEFAAARLDTIDLSESRLSHLSLVDCDLTGSNLANMEALESSMLRVTVRRCRLTGLAWPADALRDVRFEDCRADLVSFRFSRLERVRFVRCALTEADFQGVRGDSVAFVECDLAHAEFSQAQFERSEIRHCGLDGVSGVQGLRGMGMLPVDVVALAGAFASELGVRTLED
jgi:Pentapeptide repeats (9 copies)/Pentapeptide repeats (8 copies)